jgi:hypothetical protein
MLYAVGSCRWIIFELHHITMCLTIAQFGNTACKSDRLLGSDAMQSGGSLLLPSCTLQIETAGSSQTLANLCQNSWRCVPEDTILRS